MVKCRNVYFHPYGKDLGKDIDILYEQKNNNKKNVSSYHRMKLHHQIE